METARTRWAAIGAALAVTIGAGGLLPASATLDSGERGVFVPITPCRVMDTRSGADNVGPRSTPIGADETHVIPVRGTNGRCTIPADAVGLTMNVAAISPSAASFLTVYPADAPRPLAASANWVAGQPPLSNAVTADISADGKIAFYNLAGTVDIAADIVGYFVDHTHDDRYYTKAQSDGQYYTKPQLERPTTGIGVLERMSNLQLATRRWDQDPSKPATIAVGAGSEGVGFDGRFIWVANRDDDTVSKIDPTTNAVVATLTMPQDPARIAFDGRLIWVSSYSASQITTIDPATNATSALPLAGGPYAMAFDGSTMWVGLWDNDQVVQVDINTRQVLATVGGVTTPNDLAFDGSSIWAANYHSNSMTKVVVATKAATTFPLGATVHPSGVAFDGRYVYVSDVGQTSTLIRFDPADNSFVTTSTFADFAWPDSIAFDGALLWVSLSGSDQAVGIDPSDGSVDHTWTVGDEPKGLVFDGTNVWVASHNDGKATKLRTGS